jgi:hypothetical protein
LSGVAEGFARALKPDKNDGFGVGVGVGVGAAWSDPARPRTKGVEKNIRIMMPFR